MNAPVARLTARFQGLAPTLADYRGLRSSWRHDLVAGITVGVIALPLALGFGVASGVGATAGIFTAIVAGIVAAVFGGSSFQVSGPTGAMAVVLLPIVAHDGVSAVESVAVIAGVLVIAMGLVGFSRMIQFVPWPVLEGFTFGIALTIALQQVPLLAGFTKAPSSSILVSAWRSLPSLATKTGLEALLLGLLVVVIMVLLPRWMTRLPASIVAVVVGTLVAVAGHLSVPVIGALPHHLPAPRLPSLSPSIVRRLFGPALAVAALAAIESLLSARIADAMAGRGRGSDRRELVGQGLANVACGFFGGMPATGAIARTAVNVRSGAKTRVAAITHSLVIVLVILVLGSLVGRIPLAVLGAVLVVTATKMVNHVRVLTVLRTHATEAVVFALTAVVTISVNLITAIEVGLVVAGILALRSVAMGSGATQEDLADHHDGPIDDVELLGERIVIFRLDGALFFGAAPRFEEQLGGIPDVDVVILRLKGLTLIDASGAAALSQIIGDLEDRGITVLVKGARSEHERALSTGPVLAMLDERGHRFDDLESAIAHARRHVARGPHAHELGAA